MSKLVIKTNAGYVFRDHEDNLHIPEEMMKELKTKMSYEEAIMCFMDCLLDLENKQQRIDKAIEYIEKRTKETDFDNDKLIDILDILKGSDNNEENK